MKKIIILLLNCLLINIAYSQIGIDDLKLIAKSKVEEVDNYMSNHQFEFQKLEYDNDNIAQYTWTKNRSTSGQAYKFIMKFIDSKNSNKSMVILQTSDFKDYQKIKNGISSMSFKLIKTLSRKLCKFKNVGV
jgi:hypothetical protein